MTPAETTAILRQFNEWRRGDYAPSEQPEPPNPYEVGLAIDAAVEMIERLEAAEQTAQDYLRIDREKAQIAQRLEAAEKERDAARKCADMLALALNTSNHERDALRAKITEMERQEPVAFALYSGWAFKAAYHKEHEACDQRDRRQLSADLGGSLEAYRVVPLYALPGAKGE